jgi:signal peptide peptidase SppA
MNRDLLNAAVNSVWAIRRESIPSILAMLRTELLATTLLVAGPYDRPASQSSGPVAVLRLIGSISHRDSWWGGTSVERFRAQWRAALNDDSVTAILIEVDSGGGTVDGVPELAAEMFKSKGSRKPVIAVVNTFCCSAALWLASQADEIIATPSAFQGSVGCWTLHENVSKMLEMMGIEVTLVFAGARKVDGNPFEPLSDEALADMQRDVDGVKADFVAALAKGRGLSTGVIKGTFGEGRVFNAKDAMALKMVDRIGTLDEVYAKLAKLKAPTSPRAAAADAAVPPTADLLPDASVAETAAAAAADDTACDCDPDCLCQNDGECPTNCPTCESDCPCVAAAQASAAVGAEPVTNPQAENNPVKPGIDATADEAPRTADDEDMDRAVAIWERTL